MAQNDRFAADAIAGVSRRDVIDTVTYLTQAGFAGGYLERTRTADGGQQTPFVFEPTNANYCDFCLAKLMGGEYDKLADGRERCLRCTRTIVRTGEEFATLFAQTRRTMAITFGIALNMPIRVRMTNAREIARRTGETFQPTPGVDARVLGFAHGVRGSYEMYIENGAPRLAAVSTIAHELTHIWQYTNWQQHAIEQHYGREHRLEVYEGMATWVEIQYLRSINEPEFAQRQEAYAQQRTDEYGSGFRAFRERYPLERARPVTDDSPFAHPLPL
jgi:hypothetical protein